MDKFEKRKELKTQLDAINREIFSEGCKGVFTACPELTSFTWVQYTPYFNDGDECTFRVCSDPSRVKINGIEVDCDESGIYVIENDYDKNPNGKTWSEKNPPKAPEQMEKEAQEITFEDTDGNKHKFSVLGISYARYREIQQIVSDFLSENDEDTMQETFGDHVEVTLNSDGTSEDRGYEDN